MASTPKTPNEHPEGPETSTSMTVQLGPWILDHVHQGDCLSGLRSVPDDSFDIAVTSPPYWGQRGHGGLGGEEDPRDYVRDLVEILNETMRCLKPTGTLWLNIGDSYNTPINWRTKDWSYSTLGPARRGLPEHNQAYQKNRGRRRPFIDKDVAWLQYGNLLALPYRIVVAMGNKGWLYRGEVIWIKSRPMPEGRCRRPHRRHEPIYIFAKDERHSFRTDPPVGSVWRIVQQPSKTPHSSVFPPGLPLQCISAADVPKGGIVFDPFMGSGTTGVAAKMMGHHWLGFELDEGNCFTANGRISNATVQQDLPLDISGSLSEDSLGSDQLPQG